MGRIQPISLCKPCVMSVRGPSNVSGVEAESLNLDIPVIPAVFASMINDSYKNVLPDSLFTKTFDLLSPY